MLTAPLAVSLALALLTALCYLGVAAFIGRRAEDVAQRGALRAFALWWGALGAFTLVGVTRDLAASVDALSLPLLLTTTYVGVTTLTMALWGLFYYLAYIFVGRRRLLVPSLAFYVLFHVLLVYLTALLQPTGTLARTWDVQVIYAGSVSPALGLAVLGLLFMPILVAVLGYASLLFRLDRAEQRIRVALVSTALFTWFGGTFALTLVGLGEWAGLASRILGLVSVILVLLAYGPSERVGRRPTGGPLAMAPQEGHDG